MSDTVARWRTPKLCNGAPMTVVHRGAFIEDGKVVVAENSIAAIKRALELGVDMVEIDVRFTRDMVLVVHHDDILDRTTERNGLIANYDYADLADVRLVHNETREPLGGTMSTLEDVLAVIGEQMMVYVECKTGTKAFAEVAAVAERVGKFDQVTVKTHCNTEADLDEVCMSLEMIDKDLDYIPVVDDSRHPDLSFVKRIYERLKPNCIECLVRLPKGPGGCECLQILPLTMDGGLLFSQEALSLARQHETHLFVNLLYANQLIASVQWNGGRHDQLAKICPEAVYDFWLERGATVWQTDEPVMLHSWLAANGYR